jgi:hypothetical protein
MGRRLLRKRSLHHESSRGVDELETEGSRALAQAPEDSWALLSVVVCGGELVVGRSVSEHSVDEDGELSRGRGDGLGFSDAGAHATVEGAESVIASPEAHRRHAEDLGGPVGRRLGP